MLAGAAPIPEPPFCAMAIAARACGFPPNMAAVADTGAPTCAATAMAAACALALAAAAAAREETSLSLPLQLPLAVPEELVTDDADEGMGVTFARPYVPIAPGMAENDEPKEDVIFTSRFFLMQVLLVLVGLVLVGVVLVSPSRDLFRRLC